MELSPEVGIDIAVPFEDIHNLEDFLRPGQPA